MRTDGGGWLVILRRKDGSVNFRRSWNDYRFTIGKLSGEFWYGLAYISWVTEFEDQELLVELEDWEGNTAFAKYSGFKVGPREENFTLNVSGYSGTAGDALSSANGMAFTTEDSDNDRNDQGNCAIMSKAGWWFKNCHQGLLTGPYSNNPQDGRGIIWSPWKGFQYSLKSSEMKIRPFRG